MQGIDDVLNAIMFVAIKHCTFKFIWTCLYLYAYILCSSGTLLLSVTKNCLVLLYYDMNFD